MPVVSRLAICAAVSLGAHFGLTAVLELLPPLAPPRVVRTIQVRIDEPPPPQIVPPEPPPEPAKLPEPVKPPDVAPVKIDKPQPVARPSAKPAETPEPETKTPDLVRHADDSDDGPVFGVDMSSTSSGGGPGMVVGHGGRGGGSGGVAAVVAPKPAPSGNGDAPIGANEATKMPLPQGRCFGKYTPEATAAGTEGTVTLDLTVGEDGHTREITATSTLPNGLTESAIAALRACVFTPGEKDGHAQAVRIRGFKVRFALQESTQ